MTQKPRNLSLERKKRANSPDITPQELAQWLLDDFESGEHEEVKYALYVVWKRNPQTGRLFPVVYSANMDDMTECAFLNALTHQKTLDLWDL